MRVPWSSLLALVFLLSSLAGCIVEDETPPADTEAPPPAPGPTFRTLPEDGINHQDISPGGEPSILTDREGRAIWIGDTSGIRISEDNGTSWQELETLDQRVSDGYTLAQDQAGRLYAATTNIPYINVHRYDDGKTRAWTTPAVDVAPVADRPWLAATGDGTVALIHYDFGRTFSESCARSDDMGVTWTDRNPRIGDPQAGNLVFGPGGDLYYADGPIVTRLPGGSCNSEPVRADLLPHGDMGSQPMTQVAVSDAHVYVAVPSKDNDKILLAGMDKGLDGSPRDVVVSPPELGSNTFSTLSVHGDEVAVVWYGSESAGRPWAPDFEGTWSVYAAVVTGFWDAEPEIVHYRVSNRTIHEDTICMGGIGCTEGRELLDYFMADHDVWGTLHVAYGHDEGVRYARVPSGS